MEDRLAKQIMSGFADSRLNTAHLAWLVKIGVTPHIDTKLKEFFYYYQTFRNNSATDENDAAWMGEKMMNQMNNPEYNGLSNPPPPGTRIVWG